MAFTTQERTNLVEVYIAAFSRAPDAAGLGFWSDSIKNGINSDVRAAANAIFNDQTIAEVAKYYPEYLTNAEYVEQLYLNFFNRPADAEGKTFWVDAMNRGENSRGETILEMIKSLNNINFEADKALFNNKVAVGEYFAVTVKSNDVDVAKSILANITADPASVETAKSALENVTVDPPASVDTGGAAVDGSLGKTYTLTTGVDTLVGTSGNDVFLATALTLTPNDKLDGGAGTDTLKIIDAEGKMNTAIPADLDITNIEKMTVETVGTLGAFAFAGTPAVAQVNQYIFGSTAGGTMTVNYGELSISITTNPVAVSANANLFINAINTMAGATIAAVIAAIPGKFTAVNVTAPVAGTALPDITFTGDNAGAEAPTLSAIGGSGSVANAVGVAATLNTVYDIGGITDLTDATITAATGVNLKAAAITNVNVSGVTGNTIVAGGKDVTITDATANKSISVGNSAAGGDAAGKITITDTNNSGFGNKIETKGGTDVTVIATSTNADSGTITVGDATDGTASGDVKITQNLNSDGVLALNNTAVGINVFGGKTVNVAQNATSTAKAFDSNSGITAGIVTVIGDNATTDVTVATNANVTKVTKPAVDEVKTTQTIKFAALESGQTVTVDGLTFTALKDLSAAQVAAAFANLKSQDTQSTGGVVTNGQYTGKLTTPAWTSAAALGDTVVFSVAATITTAITATTGGTGTAPTSTFVAGSAGVAKVESTNAVTLNAVHIKDNATKSIENITVDGATSVTLGGGGSLNLLKTLSLTNILGPTHLNSTGKILDLTVNKVSGFVGLDASDSGATITDLNLKTTGAASIISTLRAIEVKNLTIDAGADLTVTTNKIGDATVSTLETVTIKGAAAVNLGAVASSTNLKTFDATANTGGVTATINAATAGSAITFTAFNFSQGNDVVTVGERVQKAINLGAGDDKIILATGTIAVFANIDGGTGTNTIHMDAAFAQSSSAGVTFQDKISNFQKLSIGAMDADTAVNLANMDNISYVISANSVDVHALTLTGMANNGTLELGGKVAANSGSTVVTMTDATGAADAFNIITTGGGALNMGTVTVAGVETINITSSGQDYSRLSLTADAATTIKVTGTSALDLGLTGSTKVTLIDASSMTFALAASTAASSAAATIKGGKGNDNLTATTANDVLIGGAGNDELIVANGANLVTLEGGAGRDTYVIGVTTTYTNHATIKGTAAELSGDVIQFALVTTVGVSVKAITSFNSAKIVLVDPAATFQDYVNEAAKGNITGATSWFIWAGDTYVVQDNDNAVTFVDGVDAIVKIAGVVDFTFNSTASAGAGALEIA